MKRLFVSDLHLHTWPYGATVSHKGYNSRLKAQWDALDEVLEYVDEHSVKYLYFGGDLFHTHGKIPTQALEVAGGFFTNLRYRGVKVRAIFGNHDMDNKSGSINSLYPLLAMDEHPGTGPWEDDGLTVQALPYTEDEETIKRFLGEAQPGMVMLHQGVAGVPLSSGYVLDERLTPEMVPEYCQAFSGHYHFYKPVSPNLTVIGNLTPLTWSDIDQPKGFVVWDDETNVKEQILQKPAPAFISYNSESDINVVAGNFVRYTNEIGIKDQQAIRDALIKEGALTVEFPNTKTEAGKEIRRGEAVTVEHLVEQFEDDEMEPRRREVGREIRSQKYGMPG